MADEKDGQGFLEEDLDEQNTLISALEKILSAFGMEKNKEAAEEPPVFEEQTDENDD